MAYAFIELMYLVINIENLLPNIEGLTDHCLFICCSSMDIAWLMTALKIARYHE